MSRYPRMLFKGDETCVVPDEDAQAIKVAAGWETKPLPGDPPERKKKPGPKPRE